MITTQNGPGPRGNQPGKNYHKDYDSTADQTPAREGGDDAIANSSPSDSRLDEKVVVNTQREHKAVNAPSQSEAHPSELEGSDEDVIWARCGAKQEQYERKDLKLVTSWLVMDSRWMW